MLSSVEQAFLGRDEKRAPLKTLAWGGMKTSSPKNACGGVGLPPFLGDGAY